MPTSHPYRSAVVAEPGPGWASRVVSAVAPGAYVFVFVAEAATTVEARRGGLSMKDSIEVFGPLAESRSVLVCLTPGSEPTIAANVMKHGAGALNLDATRIPAKLWKATAPRPKRGYRGGWQMAAGQQPNVLGRWPTNVVVIHEPDCAHECVPACASHELARQAGERRRVRYEWFDAEGRRIGRPCHFSQATRGGGRRRAA